MNVDPGAIKWEQVINSPAPPKLPLTNARIGPINDACHEDGVDHISINDPRYPQEKWLADLNTEIRRNQTPGVSFILHGSRADSTATAFSDIDIVALVHDDLISSSEDVYSIRKVCKRVIRKIYLTDPITHHGLMVLKKHALLDYDESFLPIDTLSRGIPLGRPHLEFAYKKNEQFSVDSARAKLDNGIDYLSRRLDRTASYFNIKNLVSSALILCVLWVQARHRLFVYKRASLEYFSSQGPANCMETVQLATLLRDIWPDVKMNIGHRIVYRTMCALGAHPQTARKVYDLTSPTSIDRNVSHHFKEFLKTIPDFVAGLQSR